MKTLRDVVAKLDPDKITSDSPGGVWGCPASYAYLCDDSGINNCVQVGMGTCSRCWSRAYKPKENPFTDIMEKIEELQTKIIALKEDFENLTDASIIPESKGDYL